MKSSRKALNTECVVETGRKVPSILSTCARDVIMVDSIESPIQNFLVCNGG